MPFCRRTTLFRVIGRDTAAVETLRELRLVLRAGQGRQFLSKLGRVPPLPFPLPSPSLLPLLSFPSLSPLPLPFPFPSFLSQFPSLLIFASDSFATLALYKFTYLLTYLFPSP